MTDEKKDVRMVLGPLAADAISHIKRGQKVAYLDDLVRKGLLYDEADEKLEPDPQLHSEVTLVGTSPNATLARLTNIIGELVSVQNASLGLIMERFDHVIEAHKVTRGMIGSMLADEDERAVVMDKLEHVFEIQQQRLDEMTERLKRTAKRRDP